MVVFIGCGKRKAIKKCEAQSMYQGDYFKTCLRYAKVLTDNKNIYILSAKYGLLHLTDIIEPYNITLNNSSKEYRQQWKERVLEQFRQENIVPTQTAIMVCGKNYWKQLADYFQEVQLPLESFKGMGEQISFMQTEIRKHNKYSLFK